MPSSVIQITTKIPPTRIDDRMQTGTTASLQIDVPALEKDLRAGIEGEVRFGHADRGLWASDAGNYRLPPIGVVLPDNAAAGVQTLAVCGGHGAAIVARAGGA